MKVIVIGGGPAGMLAAIASSEKGDQVILLEKMEALGKKLGITGKGRCNVTSSLPIEEFIPNIPGNGMFLHSSFSRFTNQDIVRLLEENGVKIKKERDHRMFPVSEQAKDVINALAHILKKQGVTICLNTKVQELLIENKQVIGVKLADESKILANKIILATGGKSYPKTGSTGDGYQMVEKLGHTISKLQGSLVPIESDEIELVKSLQGLSLKNVRIKIVDQTKGKSIYEDFGEMLFTHFGISGPTILSASVHLIRYPNIENLQKQKKIELQIDLKPAISEKQLDARLLRDFEKNKNKEFRNSLDALLPQKMIMPFIELSKIPHDKKVNMITKEERKRILEKLKCFTLSISGFRSIEEAIVTSGGIEIKEINSKTMESKLIKGLYFAGEIIDVDGYTGGFNLQIAYSTGYTAGMC